MPFYGRRKGLIQGRGREDAPLWREGKVDPGWR